MADFQVGDKVKVHGLSWGDTDCTGQIGTVKHIGSANSFNVTVVIDNHTRLFRQEQLELVTSVPVGAIKIGSVIRSKRLLYLGGVVCELLDNGVRYKNQHGTWFLHYEDIEFGEPVPRSAVSTMSSVEVAPIHHEDPTMLQPIKIEQRTFITTAEGNTNEAKNMSDDRLIAAIAEAENEIKRLSEISAQPKVLKQRIADLQSGINDLVALLDARSDEAAKTSKGKAK